jgi:Double-GTPase 2
VWQLAFLLFFFCLAVGVGIIAMAGGGAVAIVVGAAEFVKAAFAGFTPAGPIDHLRIEPPAEQGSKRDPAYRSYYAGPILLDYWEVLVQTSEKVWDKIVAGSTRTSMIKRTWSMVEKAEDEPFFNVFAVPVAIGAIAGLVLGVTGLFGLIAVTSLIFGLLLLLIVIGAFVTAGTARVAEFAVLWVRGITIECGNGNCNTRATKPLYRCPDCDATHRRLVPGLAGVLHRTCACQYKLPTLLALGKARLVAQCANCQTPLPSKGLTAPTVHIPVIAGSTAGKSVFMQTAMTRLMVRGEENGGGGFEFADDGARAQFERNEQLRTSDVPSRMERTRTYRPRAYNVYVGRERTRKRRLLYLYDPAGETFTDVEHLANFQFLKYTKGIVFVVDPFSLRAVRSASDQDLLDEVKASNTAARDVLERFVESLRERRFRTRGNLFKLPVAVVVTKADGLLTIPGSAHPYATLGPSAIGSDQRSERNAAVRRWLCDFAGSKDLVTTLENRFVAVSYFAVSYRDARKVEQLPAPGGTTVTNDDPASPLLWLLYRETYS